MDPSSFCYTSFDPLLMDRNNQFSINDSENHDYNHSKPPFVPSSPQTVMILNNDNFTTDQSISRNLSYPCITNIDIDYIDNTIGLDETDISDYHSNLGFSYSSNKTVLNNLQFNNSFSSLNSSFENLSTPPISRSSTPILCSLKKSKNHSIVNSISNLSFNFSNGVNYNLHFSAFSLERLKLINILALNENIPLSFTNNIISLLNSSDLDIKLCILQKIYKTSFRFIGNSSIFNDWCININIDSNSSDGFQTYRQILADFITLLSLLNSISHFILNNNDSISTSIPDSQILLHYYNTVSLEQLNILKTFCSIQNIDHDLLDNMIYLFWKTEDHAVCAHFRELFDN